MPPSILAPPIVPTQSLGPTYGPQLPGGLQDRHASQQLERTRKTNANPLWLYWQAFQAYRKKQDEKDDKSEQKWPQVLEDAFLDGTMPRNLALGPW
jgi:transcriptional enhancer factor